MLASNCILQHFLEVVDDFSALVLYQIARRFFTVLRCQLLTAHVSCEPAPPDVLLPADALVRRLQNVSQFVDTSCTKGTMAFSPGAVMFEEEQGENDLMPHHHDQHQLEVKQEAKQEQHQQQQQLQPPQHLQQQQQAQQQQHQVKLEQQQEVKLDQRPPDAGRSLVELPHDVLVRIVWGTHSCMLPPTSSETCLTGEFALSIHHFFACNIKV